MKNLKILAIFIIAAAVLSSCGGLNKMVKEADLVSYQVTPEVLEMHGGVVDVTLDVNFPAKYFNKKAVVTLTPVLRYKNGEKELNSLVLQGEDVTQNNKVISYDNGGKASISNKFKFEDEMLRSELYCDVSAEMKGKTAKIGDVKLADGIIATSQLVSVDPKVLMFQDKFERILPESYETDIKYVINRADVRSSEITKDEVKQLNEVLKQTQENERLELKELEISAYASPDGPVDLNTNLAAQRKTSADRYLSGQMKRANVEVADELMSMMTTPEDWEGFKKLMEESNIQDKEMILRVLSMHSDPVVREQEIKNLSAAFEVIKDEILPKLRRSKFTVKMEHIGWSDEELKDLWTSNPDTLKLEELLYAATLFDNNETKLAIYKKTANAFPQCARAHSNMGAVLYKMGDLNEAEKAFKDAKGIMDHDILNNNLGAIALKNGDLEAAKEAFTASLGAGEKVNYNLGIVNIMEGNYDAALNNFGSEPSFNAALAKYLKGDDDGAWRTAANISDDNPHRYYLLAVIAANQDKPEVAVENLKLAIEKSESPGMLIERIMNDVEFAKIKNLDAFKAILQ
ncbi:MAG TPA: hypothetical protein ENO20_14700 [Bacteroides sp.]|nr:hypothetical protein [Bacteroides sp.]